MPSPEKLCKKEIVKTKEVEDTSESSARKAGDDYVEAKSEADDRWQHVECEESRDDVSQTQEVEEIVELAMMETDHDYEGALLEETAVQEGGHQDEDREVDPEDDDEDDKMEHTDDVDQDYDYNDSCILGIDAAEEHIYVAVCDTCGATHLCDVDVMSLGLDFTCGHVGCECEGAMHEASPAAASPLEQSTPKPLPHTAKLDALSAEEKQDLFNRHYMQLQEAKLKPKEILHGVKQLYDKQMPKERYIDSEIVTRKGERFIKINRSLDPGPGCQIGGVLGWRSKMGRRGLGMQKMTKEEREKVCISNKNRAHETTVSGPGGRKKSYTFESKVTQLN